MSHPYLNFSLSTDYDGYIVGTSSFQERGDGLINKKVKIINIPKIFNDEPVTEIGNCAFMETKITSIFISNTIKIIGEQAFCLCESLSEVRFEANSQLEEVKLNAFAWTSVVNFDIPKSVNYIDYWETFEYLFFEVYTLDCFSYLGTTDFSDNIIFSSYTSPAIRVSQNYPTNQFGQESVTHKDGSTCGVSNEPFYEEIEKTFNIRRERISHVIFFLVLILVS